MLAEDEEKKSADKGRKHRPSGFEAWGGYMASKKMKLAAQFSGQRDMEIKDREEIRTDIFKGISIFVNGYTKPSADELKRLMMVHGGTYHHYFSSKTTHTIASNLPYSKIKNLKNQIVVKPEWITDSIKAGKLLPYQNYFLYPPEVTHKQPRLNFENFTESKSSTIEPNKNYDFQSSHLFLPQGASKTFDSTNKESCGNSWEFGDTHYKIAHNSSSANSAKLFPNFNSPSKIQSPVTAGHPSFLSEFYSHSRLHHISTAGQELKRYVQTLVDNHGSKPFPGRENLKSLVKNGHLPKLQNDFITFPLDGASERKQRVIMHLDMDCFFVSVGLRKYPELKGKPVAVTHSKGKRGGPQEGSDAHYEATHYRNQSKKKIEGLTSVANPYFSDVETFDDDDDEFVEKPKISKYSKEYGSLSEIASCSYEARRAGVRNGMFLGEALRRCPDLKTIPYDFEGYSEVSKQLYDIVANYSLDVEAVSCDELYIDCTELLQETGISPLQFASHLRSEIEQKTKCTASAGLGANMLLARLANKAAKPNGQYYVTNEHIEEFMKNQNVRDLPGVGYSTSIKFEHLGVFSCSDLQKWSQARLQQEFGPKTGQTLYKRCRGKDSRTVQLQKERKSVSAEINYGIRFEKEEDVFKFLKELTIEVVNRLNNINSKAKCITLKLMVRRPDAPMQTAKFMGHGVCDHIVKSVSLKSATNDSLIIGHECCMLARTLKIKPEDYRGVGIQLSKLEKVHKDNRCFRSIESFICSDIINEESQSPNEKFGFQQTKLDLQKETRNFKNIDSFIYNDPFNGEFGNHHNKNIRSETISKDITSFKSIESLICPDVVNIVNEELESDTNKIVCLESNNHQSLGSPCLGMDLPLETVNTEIFAPKELEPVHKSLPKGASIKDYLSDKPSPTKLQKQICQPEAISLEEIVCLESNNHQTLSSPCLGMDLPLETINTEIFDPKELELVHKPLPKGASIKDYLSDKPFPTQVQKQTCQQAMSIEEIVCLESNDHQALSSPCLGMDLPIETVNTEIFAPKELELVHKHLPKGASIKDYLSDKPSPTEVQKQTCQPQAMSIEELDQSVLNALPEDLQKEILEMYGTKTSTKASTSAQHSSTSTHPNHSTSSKINKHHTKKGTQAHVNKNKIPTKQNTLFDCVIPTKNHSTEEKEEESVLKKKASIGGAENINEVRSLVKEWVLSSQVVLEEDIDQFRDFLLQVIDEDLRKVDLILKYFHRVVTTANSLWQQAYLTILSYVQQKMLHKYGTMLEARSDFPT